MLIQIPKTYDHGRVHCTYNEAGNVQNLSILYKNSVPGEILNQYDHNQETKSQNILSDFILF